MSLGVSFGQVACTDSATQKMLVIQGNMLSLLYMCEHLHTAQMFKSYHFLNPITNYSINLESVSTALFVVRAVTLMLTGCR